jgi:hypothetical protein
LKPEQHGKSHANKAHDNSRDQELLRDHFVVLTEHIVSPEIRLTVVVMRVFCVFCVI